MPIDLITSGGGLGSLEGRVLLFNHCPVVKLEDLAARKREIIEQSGHDPDELLKSQGDLKTIEELLEERRRQSSA